MWGLKHKSHNCERCGNNFFSRSALRYHFHAKHLGRIHCDTCGRKLSQGVPRQYVEIHPEKTLPGNQGSCCNIERETRFVTTEMSISCRMCSKQFGTVHAREHHEKQEHHFTAGKRAQMSMGFKPESILKYKTPLEVEKFLEAKLQPISVLRIACASEVDGIIALIKEVFPLPVTHVSKGGSYIKGTDLQDWSDVDIVLFSDAFKSLEDCKRKTPAVLEDLVKKLLTSSWNNRLIFGKRTPFSLRLYFKCYKAHHGHSFDIMPCYDTFGPALLTDLKKSFYHKVYLCNDSDKIQLYSMALLKYQVAFIKASTERVKNLMRLVKHWFRTSFAKPTEENKFRRLPSSYSMELLTIYVWELAGKPVFFSFVQGLRAVLKLLVQYQEICIVWHKYYKPTCAVFQKVISKQTRPIVLDPVNPTFNVCANSNAWDEVAHVARQSLLKPLFSGVRAKEPWLFTNNW